MNTKRNSIQACVLSTQHHSRVVVADQRVNVVFFFLRSNHLRPSTTKTDFGCVGPGSFYISYVFFFDAFSARLSDELTRRFTRCFVLRADNIFLQRLGHCTARIIYYIRKKKVRKSFGCDENIKIHMCVCVCINV